MDELNSLLNIDFKSFIQDTFIIIACLVTICVLLIKFFDYIGRPIKWLKNRNQDHELLIKTVQDLKTLHDKHEEDTKQSIRHDAIIREDLRKLTTTVDDISDKLETMQKKMDATEMAKLKEKILAYYRKYSPKGEWEQFESDVFWGLYDSYISHGGNSFVKDDIEPVMRKLRIKD